MRERMGKREKDREQVKGKGMYTLRQTEIERQRDKQRLRGTKREGEEKSGNNFLQENKFSFEWYKHSRSCHFN